MPDEFDAKKTYAAAVKAHSSIEKDAAARKSALKTLYESAVQELGYSEKELTNNRDKQMEVAKLMFSDKYAGNADMNPLLEASKMYSGWDSGLSAAEKQQIHLSALGTNYSKFMEGAQGYSLSSHGFNTILQQTERRFMQDATNASLFDLVEKDSGSHAETAFRYAALASLDPNIAKIDGKNLDLHEVKGIASQSISGQYDRATLEETVGVELPKYDWAA